MAKAEERSHPNGSKSWRVRYRLGGKTRSMTLYKQAAAEHFAELINHSGPRAALAWLSEQEGQGYDPDIPTLDEYAIEYFETHLNATEGTLRTYRRMYDRRWSPLLGHLRFDQINRATIQRAIRELPQTWTDKTLRNHHTLLAAIFASAMENGVTIANPARGIKLARRTSHEQAEMRFLTHQEFARLVAVIPAHYQPIVMMLAGTGMRWGEAEALSVGDVDLELPVVRITKAVKWDPSKATREIGPTKTLKSKRTVVLPPETVESIRPLVEGRRADARLFLAPRGGPLRHRTFYDTWKKSCEAAELEPQPRIHDLRHSHVAWLIAAGTPLPVIQARLGHSTITTTIDRYGHLLPDLQRQAADAASVALSGVRLTAGPETPAIEG